MLNVGVDAGGDHLSLSGGTGSDPVL